MATLAATHPTLLDFAKRLDPATNAVSVAIAELLSQSNDILEDIVWKEGNLPTGERLTVRTSNPTAAFRELNAGTAASKSTTAQIDEACGILEALSEIDKDIADLNGNTTQFRMSENSAFIESLHQKFAQTLIYGDATSSPEEFTGFAPRYNSLSGTNAQNVITGGGAGSDNTSIWLVGWSQNTVYGIFPKGSVAGLSHTGSSEPEWAFDSSNNRYKAYIDHYQWKCGVAVKDWRNIVRIPNIDVSALVAESSDADLIALMSRAIDRLPSLDGIKPVFYANRTIFSFLRIQALRTSGTNSGLTIAESMNQFGKSRKQLEFLGIPVRMCDRILNTEATIS